MQDFPPVEDLRSFLDRLRDAGELARVQTPVSLEQEVGAICFRNLRNKGPGLLFEHLGDQSIVLAVDLLASRRRYALALGVESAELAAEWNRRTAKPLAPTIVERGICQQNVSAGEQVDLTKLPVPVWNQLDGGPYLTLSCHISKDPETQARNVGVYRNQVFDRNTLGILVEPYGHLRHQWSKRPGEPLPVAIVLGSDPVVPIAAVAPVPYGRDELAVAGALRGKSLELVRCITIPLEVPASAEIVIEGELLPNVLREEGPFGEFTGYYGGHRGNRPTIRVKAITHRDYPILHAIYEGRPQSGSYAIVAVPREAELLRQITLPGVKRAHMSPGGGGALHAVVSVDKPYEGFGKYVGLAVLGTTAGRGIKQVIVVDDDVDPADPTQVEWAVATRVQPHRDIEILSELPGIILDPSLERGDGRPPLTSKMIIDATRYDAKTFAPVCLPSADVMAKVEREWSRYGIVSR
ncbi:MAG TPA: UbiD family decarboxylase [Candidatus Binatia bacterium]|jgi:UbiD family decarboxylase